MEVLIFLTNEIMRPNLKEIFTASFQDNQGKFIDVLTQHEINLLIEHKLFKCFLPASLGGLGLSLEETLLVIEEAAFINGSLGWLVQIGNGGMYFATNFPEELAEKFLRSTDAVISGSGTPTTTATAVEGGYRLSGSWRLCSGSAYATLFTVTFYTPDQNEVLSAVVPRKEVHVIEDWDTIGMRNTSTNTIQVTDVFIPFAHTFKVTERKSYLNEKVLGLPFILYAQAFFIHVVYGVFERMLEETQIALDIKRMEWTVKNPERIARLERLIREGELLIQNGKATTAEIIAIMLKDNYTSTPEIEDGFQSKFSRVAVDIRKHAHEMFHAIGIDVLYRGNAVTICYLDLLSVSQHKLLAE